MSTAEFDPKTLTVNERLDLINRLWLSIAVDAKHGDERATEVMDFDRQLEPDIRAEIVRRLDELERDPSRGIRWEDLREKLRRKYE